MSTWAMLHKHQSMLMAVTDLLLKMQSFHAQAGACHGGYQILSNSSPLLIVMCCDILHSCPLYHVPQAKKMKEEDEEQEEEAAEAMLEKEDEADAEHAETSPEEPKVNNKPAVGAPHSDMQKR